MEIICWPIKNFMKIVKEKLILADQKPFSNQFETGYN